MSFVWRLGSRRHLPLSGEGARLAGGRWNSSGRALIYASESLALCLAECLVHVTGSLPTDYFAFKIELPADGIEALDLRSLKRGWDHDLKYTRAIGDRWLAEARSLALWVPSIILPESMNALLNPIHPRAIELKVVAQREFKFDPRLRPTS